MPTDQEKIAFANAVIEQLDDDEMVKKFQENVQQVGVWANQIDASFDKVTRKFTEMVDKYGKDFPGFSDYKNEWVGYYQVILTSSFFRSALTPCAFQRWVKLLALSRDVASEHVTILRREHRSSSCFFWHIADCLG